MPEPAACRRVLDDLSHTNGDVGFGLQAELKFLLQIAHATAHNFPMDSEFTITFDPSLSPEQVKATLEALADYFREVGGLGFEVEFMQEVFVSEFAHA